MLVDFFFFLLATRGIAAEGLASQAVCGTIPLTDKLPSSILNKLVAHYSDY